MMARSLLFISLVFLGITATSCYRMPTEDDYSLIPLTNNPTYTRERASSPVPGVGY